MVQEVRVDRLFNGDVLERGEIFINMRPSKKSGKILVRLFESELSARIVTRLWNVGAVVRVVR